MNISHELLNEYVACQALMSFAQQKEVDRLKAEIEKLKAENDGLRAEKYTYAKRAEWYEKLAEVRQRNINAADNELKVAKEELAKADAELQATKEELANIKKQLDLANKKIESLKRSNDTLSTTVGVLTDDNRRLKEANELLSATHGNIRVANIVTALWPNKRVRTTVYWGDSKPTTVTLAEGDTADPYTAFCAAFAKKMFGSTHKVRKLVEDKRTIVCFNEAKEGDIDVGH